MHVAKKSEPVWDPTMINVKFKSDIWDKPYQNKSDIHDN
jgi:hypothetical protein